MKSFIKKLDGFRSSIVLKSDRSEPEVLERLKQDQFDAKKTGRHGFPYRPTCLDYDPLQNILAIGTENGAIRILGKPGVECHVTHENDAAVKQLLFLVNEGGIISVCEDSSLHLWSLRQTQPAIIHSLKFYRERITYCHLPFQCKWLYVGTERGNVHLVNIETFILSGYTINWNKVIDVSCKRAPGPVVHISDNPVDPTKLLVCHESGNLILWDLRAKMVDVRFTCQNSIKSACWLSSGRQFVCSHNDGSLTVWNVKTPGPCEVLVPYGKLLKNGKTEVCSAIEKIQWIASKSGDNMMLFSGGTAYGNHRKGITFQQGKTKKLLTSEEVVDFTCIYSSPYVSDFQDPKFIIVLLTNELLVFDISTLSPPMFPLVDIPYSFTIHESPVTCTQYYVSCPQDLLPALFKTGVKLTRSQSSTSSQHDKEWPINGGTLGQATPDTCNSDLVITGHADGSVKFWDATSCTFQFLCKLSTYRYFEKVKVEDDDDEDYLAIQQIVMCIHSRTLVLSNASNFVMVFKFSDKEQTLELIQLDVNMNPETADNDDEVITPTTLNGETSTDNTAPSETTSSCRAVKWKNGTQKNISAGFHPQLCCQCDGTPDPEDGGGTTQVSSLSISSSYAILAVGNHQSLALIDLVQKTLITVLHIPDIYLKSNTSSKLGSVSPPIMENDTEFFVNAWKNEAKPEDERDRKKRKLPRSTSEMGNNGRSSSRTTHRSLSAQLSGSSGEGIDTSDGSAASRSSSLCGNEGIPEIIQTITFAFTFSRKTEPMLSPCVFLGTSLGTVYVLSLTIPPSEQRTAQAVTALPSGLQFNQKGPVLAVGILNNEGHLFPAPFEFWKSEKSKRSSKSDSSPPSPVTSGDSMTRHFAVICTEKQAKVVSLPSHNTPYKVDLGDEVSFVLKADIIVVEGSSCLVCLNTSAHLQVFSLPSLQTLLDIQCCLPMTNYRFIRTFVFAYEGQAIFMSSPSEIERISCLAKAEETWCEVQSTLFTIVHTPDKPSKGFFSTLFSSTASTLDREQLFGVESGRASRGIAQMTPGTGQLESLQASRTGLAHQMSKNKELLMERQEKLGELEERTSEMRMRAEDFSSHAYALMQREKNRKWYQL